MGTRRQLLRKDWYSFYLSSLLASAGITPLGAVSIAFWTCCLLTGFSTGLVVGRGLSISDLLDVLLVLTLDVLLVFLLALVLVLLEPTLLLEYIGVPTLFVRRDRRAPVSLGSTMRPYITVLSFNSMFASSVPTILEPVALTFTRFEESALVLERCELIALTFLRVLEIY